MNQTNKPISPAGSLKPYGHIATIHFNQLSTIYDKLLRDRSIQIPVDFIKISLIFIGNRFEFCTYSYVDCTLSSSSAVVLDIELLTRSGHVCH